MRGRKHLIKIVYIFIIGLFINETMFVSSVYAEEINTGQVYRKEKRTNISMYDLNQDDMPEEFIYDLEGVNNIWYLVPQTNANYEIALAYSDGSYSYLSSAESFSEAVALADKAIEIEGEKDNTIPVVVDKNGLITYATEGIGRLVKLNTEGNIADKGLYGYIGYIYRGENDKTIKEYTYFNHGYIDDVPIISDNGTMVKVEIAGYSGWIDKQDTEGMNIIYVPLNQSINLSYYVVENGELKHYISSDITTEGKGWTRSLGVAPSFMVEGKKYYSYDGEYFYDSIEILLKDVKEENHSNSININNKYYNYYMYLPGRSHTSFTSDELNKYIDNNTKDDSVMKNKNLGEYFVSAGEEYGVNPFMSLAIAMHESAGGTSAFARNNNNLFGANVQDLYPDEADKFETLGQGITEVTQKYLSNNYLNPRAWVYNGGYIGNKRAGVNVRYASDPYWSEKVANFMFDIDKYLSEDSELREYNKDPLFIYTEENTITNELGKTIYSIESQRKNNGQIMQGGQIGDTTILKSIEDNRYKIVSDRTTYAINESAPVLGFYDWNETCYIEKKGLIQINKVGQDFNNDGELSIIDLAYLSSRYGSTDNDAIWQWKYDLNFDGNIDIFDIVLLSNQISE